MNRHEKREEVRKLSLEIDNLERQMLEAKTAADMLQRMIDKKQLRLDHILDGKDVMPDQTGAWGEQEDTVFDPNYQSFPVEH